ncbi:unnamed protein product [marine sediment metagenome]|uniref:Uncharacterized protein n=1 Tax=marine sediment metagenome TaxID=412755 RepID=X1JF06_9ZZZZ
MSVRAHRILKVEYAPNTSFNLYYDQKLIEFFDRNNDGGFYSQMNDGGGGVVSIEVSAIKEAIEKAAELQLDEDTVKQLKADIEAAGDNDFVDYDCF